MVRFYVLFFLAVVWGPFGQVLDAKADSFGSGANSFEIEFVTIGSPGNPPDGSIPGKSQIDSLLPGSVPYAYRIGKFEISEQMIEKANSLGGLGITKDVRGPDKPATNVSWFEAAKFVNWLNTSTGNAPAYKFDADGDFQLWQPIDPGYDPSNLFRNQRAMYFLPSADEWYKAAYYDPSTGVYWDYPTGSNAPPIAVGSGTAPGTAMYHQGFFDGPADATQAGGLSPFGTMAQGGNVEEWEESELDGRNDELSDYRIRRGGNWDSSAFGLSVSFAAGGFPTQSYDGVGFRVASVVPEPTCAFLCTIVFGVFWVTRVRRRQWR